MNSSAQNVTVLDLSSSTSRRTFFSTSPVLVVSEKGLSNLQETSYCSVCNLQYANNVEYHAHLDSFNHKNYTVLGIYNKKKYIVKRLEDKLWRYIIPCDLPGDAQ
jgi:hypothetical protein